ncbi:MAG: protein-L-isoaspartate(D-aspartate) O-methyltransferase [Candidatus Palauibacterales bacterium]|jgi:protein-L-isoaspartate(D-aspartate) O-methyltransferase|nr:protein-L-isoaspartate(D-aspartate) O-methyltransferase [Candidatus Palauibacterales bacterium]
MNQAYRRDRRRLIEALQAGGVNDLAILHAFDAIPRHLFVPDAVRHRSYEDVALPLGYGQTISRPGAHALHLGLAGLSGEERVLEIGTGSGYQTALLSQLAGHVYSVETVTELADLAAERLGQLGLANVTLRVGDGSTGWPEEAPFDVILCGAAAPRVPAALVHQLSAGGRLIIPVGDDEGQELLRVTLEHDGSLREETVDVARFVPLKGEQGW